MTPHLVVVERPQRPLGDRAGLAHGVSLSPPAVTSWPPASSCRDADLRRKPQTLW